MAAPASTASTWNFTCGHEGGPPLGARDACQQRQSSQHHAVAGSAPRPARRSPTRAEQPATQPTSRDCCVGVQQADKRGRAPCMPHADERGVISATQNARVLHHCSAQLKCTGEHARSHARNENTHERANKHTNKRTNEQTKANTQTCSRHRNTQHSNTTQHTHVHVCVCSSHVACRSPFCQQPAMGHGP